MPGFFPMQYALKPKKSQYIRSANERTIPHALRSVAQKPAQQQTSGGDHWSTGEGQATNKRFAWDDEEKDGSSAAEQNASRAAQQQRNACDLKTVMKMNQDAKAEWLDTSLWAVQQDKFKPVDVFDIITHPKFVAGVGKRVGPKMLRLVTNNIFLFSEKQRDIFYKCSLNTEFEGFPLPGDEGYTEERSRSRSPKAQNKIKKQKKQKDPRTKQVHSAEQDPAGFAMSSSEVPQAVEAEDGGQNEHRNQREDSPKRPEVENHVTNFLSGILNKFDVKELPNSGKVAVLSAQPAPVEVAWSAPSKKAVSQLPAWEHAISSKELAAASSQPVSAALPAQSTTRATPVAKKSGVAPGDVICELCRRKFSCEAMLRKHERLSDLHKQNLAKLRSR